MTKRIFITGTGTDIGKTFVTTHLCSKFIADKKKIMALKPVISGWHNPDADYDNSSNDVLLILEALSLPETQENIEEVSLYRLALPMSPNIAAKKDCRKLDFNKIVQFCNRDIDTDYILIEGVGGLMVPLNDNHTVLDLICELPEKSSVIVVAGTYLGAISDTLLTIEVLTSKNIPIDAVIISESVNHGASLADTAKTIRRFASQNVIEFPRVENGQAPQQLSKLMKLIK